MRGSSDDTRSILEELKRYIGDLSGKAPAVDLKIDYQLIQRKIDDAVSSGLSGSSQDMKKEISTIRNEI